MLAYAAADTEHLPALREALRARLSALGRLGWAEEEFARLEDLRWTGASEGGDAYLRIKGAKALPPRQLAALRELYRGASRSRPSRTAPRSGSSGTRRCWRWRARYPARPRT